MAVIITGGTGAIGSAMACAFAKTNDVAIIYKSSDENARQLEKELGCKADKTDVSSAQEVSVAVERIAADFGKIDVLINNAGISQIKLLSDVTELDWYNMVDVHLTGAFNMTKAVLPFMISRKQGSIINISSMNAFRPLTKIPAYSAAKAGISNFTEWLAVHFAPCGIRVNAIAPGFFVTNQNRALLFDADGNPTARTGKILAATPQKRFGEVSDLIGTLLWLASDDASGFVTGVIVPVDGGFNAYSGV